MEQDNKRLTDAQTTRTCRVCGESKPITEFTKAKGCANGYSWRCTLCNRARTLAWQLNSPEKKKVKGLKYYYRHADKTREQNREKRRKLRRLTIEAYGGHCVCCGEDTPEFLTIDHIDGSGGAWRRANGWNPSQKKGTGSGCGTKMYQWLKSNGFPKDNFQLLCWNCNVTKGLYGECPHKRINLLDFETAETITANLLAAVRTMEEVTMTVAVTERMVR
jgi:hypothetical protein